MNFMCYTFFVHRTVAETLKDSTTINDRNNREIIKAIATIISSRITVRRVTIQTIPISINRNRVTTAVAAVAAVVPEDITNTIGIIEVEGHGFKAVGRNKVKLKKSIIDCPAANFTREHVRSIAGDNRDYGGHRQNSGGGGGGNNYYNSNDNYKQNQDGGYDNRGGSRNYSRGQSNYNRGGRR